MITFTLCLLALVVGYFTYGRLMERVFILMTVKHRLLQRLMEWTIFHCPLGRFS